MSASSPSSSRTRTRTTQNFRISVTNADSAPQTLSLDIIVSSQGPIRLDVRLEDPTPAQGVRTVHVSPRSTPESPPSVTAPIATSPAQNLLSVDTSTTGPSLTSDPSDQNAARSRRVSHPIRGTNDHYNIPPPAYSRRTTHAQTLLQDAPIPVAYAGPEPPSRLPPPPPIRPILRDLYEAMQRGEFVPAVFIDEPEELTFPLSSSGRRRRHGEEELDEGESDGEEERYAKRSRIQSSWGPLDFLRPWR
ncbi:hypothetical protein C8R43DRAFT_957785 [Mycena crocata]|nr:hypothetical protein C8R43DRAFT_957785 [Mycena crocata]